MQGKILVLNEKRQVFLTKIFYILQYIILRHDPTFSSSRRTNMRVFFLVTNNLTF